MVRRLDRLLSGWQCRTMSVLWVLLFASYVLFFTYVRDSQHSCQPHLPAAAVKWGSLWPTSSPTAAAATPTNLSHIVFGIISSLKTVKTRKPLIESWWRPNMTRGYLFLDKAPPETDESLRCPSTCPPIRISEDISHWNLYPKFKHAVQIRIFRTILETFREGDRDVRWFVMADDDTVFFVDNIVELLSKLDHTKHHYLWGRSESVGSNAVISFDMGYGGAGLVFSYPTAEVLVQKMDGCIRRYPEAWTNDGLTHRCLNDQGIAVSTSFQKGFHQIDLHDSLAGFLSSHPQAPLLSLHHIELVDPIFPSKNRVESIHHLMKPAKLDQSRLLQQTICYRKEMNWTVSVSWGYSVHIYESPLPRNILQHPIETFNPWRRKDRFPKFMFNTRNVSRYPCQAPHWFFFESIEENSLEDEDTIVTTYTRARNRGLSPCVLAGNHSADHVNSIRVLSPPKTRL
ncbi:hypothetical protein SAY86_025672 [Trapa natans]|uniref:Uncharacterized protein n=1 Tax=Trapa natans TaxID=22666 RepID=A0AAN7QDR1_TRANT|nr:hypothetical protein SAY86_025672 [Trapa natans]